MSIPDLFDYIFDYIPDFFDDILKALESDNVVFSLLDLTAAFDTVDHTVLIERLRRTFKISGSALQNTILPQ